VINYLVTLCCIATIQRFAQDQKKKEPRCVGSFPFLTLVLFYQVEEIQKHQALEKDPPTVMVMGLIPIPGPKKAGLAIAS
jgi:hypothetical protein